MEKKTARQSNIEILRIVAMLMIIAYHIIIHCVNIQLSNTMSIERMQNGWFSTPDFYRQLMMLALMMPMGLVGNAIFIMISGYFLIDRDIDMLKISKKLLGQLLFAAVVLVLASTFCIWYTKDNIATENLLNYIKIQYFNKMSWFVGYYFIIILIAFMFLNKFLAKLNAKQHLGFMFAIFAVTELGWSGKLLDDLASGLRTVFIGVFLYSFAGYIKKYDPFKRVRTYVFFLLIILVNGIVGISYYNNVMGKIQTYNYNLLMDPTVELDFVQTIPKYENFSIVVVLIGICMFELFRRMPIPSSKPINYLAQTTFMIYLLHDNGLAYSIWETEDWITLLYHDASGFLVKLSCWTLKVFAVGALAYGIYIALVMILKKSSWLFIKKG